LGKDGGHSTVCLSLSFFYASKSSNLNILNILDYYRHPQSRSSLEYD
jgi:hypothetical protein